MNRRAFLRLLGLGSVAVAVAPTVLEALTCAPAAPPPLAFSSTAFMRAFDPMDAALVNRFDVLYGFGCMAPQMACRIEGA